MADSDRKHFAAEPAAIGRRVYRFLTRIEVLAAVTIVLVCAAFLLDTRWHRNLFYVAALPVFVLHLRGFDWRLLRRSTIARLTLAYLGYFLVSALWSDGFTWAGLADLLRVTLLLGLFLLAIFKLASAYDDFEARLFAAFAATAGVSGAALFVAGALGPLSFGTRLTGFGLAEHPIIGATLYGFALLLCAFVLLPGAKDRRLRLVWTAVILACAAFLLMSGSRGPLIALAAALMVGLASADRRLALAVAALFAAGLAAGLLTDFRPVELLHQRAQSGHFEIWQQSLAAVAERPWFGHGSLTDLTFDYRHGAARSPHNLPLANHLYGGLPATLLLAGLLLAVAGEALRALRGGRPVYLVVLTFGLVAALFDSRSLVQNLGREWITLWLPICLLAAREALRRQAPSQVLRQ